MDISVQTLLIISTLAIFSSAISLTLLWIAHRDIKATVFWATCAWLLILCLSLFAMQSKLPALLGIILANTCWVVMFLGIRRGLLVAIEKVESYRNESIILISFLLIYSIFTYIDPSYTQRTRVGNIYLFGLCLWVSYTAWKHCRIEFKISAYTIAISLLIFALTPVISTLFSLFAQYEGMLDENNLPFKIIMSMILVTQLFFNFAFAIMVGEIRHKDIRQLSERDQLTNCWNRRAMFSHFQYLQTHKKTMQYAVAIIDFDDFKQVNDIGGHAVGDEWIKKIVSEINEHCRTSDFLVRLGGDEFLLLMENTISANAEIFCNDLVSHIKRQSMHVGTQDVHMSVSIGVSGSDNISTPIEAIMMVADTALYQAKENGKGLVVRICGAELNQDSRSAPVIDSN
jgi:diguanylate cyclase (GGDEF)-like protein